MFPLYLCRRKLKSMLINIQGKQIFAFSDTHGKHRQVVVPENIETVIFAGDACDGGNMEQLMDFFDWYSDLPVKNKLFVPGNHDLPFELYPDLATGLIPPAVTYIEEGGIILDGIRYYVLPVRMKMHYQATGAPYNIDVLITHGVPAGVMDEGIWGCPLLRELVEEVAPKVHVFGHIHSCGGQSISMGKTRFYNVAMLDNSQLKQ
jgi:predicted phosphohydrolase